MKTSISIISVFLFLYFFTKKDTIAEPIDYNRIIYTDNINVDELIRKSENLKTEIKLLQFSIKNKMGIDGETE